MLYRAIRLLPFIGFPIACGFASVATGEDITGDTLIYHYYDAWAFLSGRDLRDVFPGGFQSLLNPLLDVPPYLLDTHIPPTYAGFIIGCWQGLSPLLIYLIALRMARSPIVALLAGLAAAIAGGFASQLGSMMGDSSVAPFFLLAVFFSILGAQHLGNELQGSRDTTNNWNRLRRQFTAPTGYWMASGASAGIGVGLKFAESSMAAAMLLCLPLLVPTVRQRLRAVIAWTIGLVLGVGALAGYWTYFLWRHYGDPFAFTGAPFWIFRSPYESTNVAYAAWHGPANYLQATYFPIYWYFHETAVIGIAIREASLPIAYVIGLGLLPLTAVRIVRSLGASKSVPSAETLTRVTPSDDQRIDRYLIGVFFTTLAIWLKVFATYRYIIPLELLSPIIVLATLRRISPQRVLSHKFAFLYCTICVLCIVTASPGNSWLRIPFGPKEFSLATPAMLRNGHLDALVEENANWEIPHSNPDAFVLPELKAKFIAIGSAGLAPTPDIMRLNRAAFRKVQRAGGSIIGFWISTRPPSNQIAYLATLGEPGLRQQACVQETLFVGAGYEPIGFCRYVPIVVNRSPNR